MAATELQQKALNPVSLSQATCPASVHLDLFRSCVEAWDYINERAWQNQKGRVVFMTCLPFTYEVDHHSHTMVECNLRPKQLPQGQHLKNRRKIW